MFNAEMQNLQRPRSIVILGSTGSIGQSTLDVVARHPGRFTVSALAAHSNVELLADQYLRFRPRCVCIVDESKRDELSSRLKGESVDILAGEAALIRLAGLPDCDVVVNAVVGSAGLKASIEAVKAGRALAVANKESLVAGGPLFPALVKKTGAKILPIDSEHSAIWQALRSGNEGEVRALILTSSGGPFRTWPIERFAEITVEQALNHPTWSMGPKITIDSATLANKGLEILEAMVLFDLEPERIRVVIHPQSIIHSMVEFVDSSVVAQLSLPDMRLPITYALFWPERVESEYGRIDWTKLPNLTFETPDMDRFPMLRLAYRAGQAGGTAPAVYNAANEVAVAAFRERVAKFTQIADIVDGTLNSVTFSATPDLGEILEADRHARSVARKLVETYQ